jgi:hypothetical protein
MLEDDGQEWWGYGFMFDHSDAIAVEKQFIENVLYLEFYCRNLGLERRGLTLAKRIAALFDRLPAGCESHITDDRVALVRAIVDFRNRTAHGTYDSTRPSSDRVLALSIKVAALLHISETLDESGNEEALRRASMGGPFLRKMLATTDRSL